MSEVALVVVPVVMRRHRQVLLGKLRETQQRVELCLKRRLISLGCLKACKDVK